MTRACVLAALLSCLSAPPAPAADYPPPVQGDYVIRNFAFTAGGSLAELKLHYRTIGQPRKDAAGRVRNAVLVLHGTTGSSTQFLRPELGVLEREITRVPKGRAVVIPVSEATRGHGSHTIAGLWKHLLAELLAASERPSG